MTQYTTLDMNHFTGWRERNQVNIQGKKKHQTKLQISDSLVRLSFQRSFLRRNSYAPLLKRPKPQRIPLAMKADVGYRVPSGITTGSAEQHFDSIPLCLCCGPSQEPPHQFLTRYLGNGNLLTSLLLLAGTVWEGSPAVLLALSAASRLQFCHSTEMLWAGFFTM